MSHIHVSRAPLSPLLVGLLCAGLGLCFGFLIGAAFTAIVREMVRHG